MATIVPTIVPVGEHGWLVTWASIANGDVCDPIKEKFSDFADRTVHAQSPSAWGGATLTLEGSNNGADYSGLNSTLGTAISFTANGIRAVVETPIYTKPVLSGGAASSVNVFMFIRRQRGGKEI